MNSVLVVVLPKVHEFSFKVRSIPEEDVVKVFTTSRPNESLNEGMRKWRIRDTLNLLDIQDAKVCFPSVVLE